MLFRSFSINWANINSRNFIYHLRQDPGPNNALGRVKFMFPNRFNVYLHDTPSRDLFSKTERAFSSGCIRIEKPIELAEYLLREDPKWTREAILAALEKSRDKIIRLPKPMPVHLLYMTVFTDKDGNVNFRNDIYGRDAILNKAMKSEMNPF